MEQGILKLTERVRGEAEANAVRIGITVEGENFLYGNAAFEKCEEVKRSVERLRAVEPGIGISVKGVYVQSETGWFSKSSRGVYHLELALKGLVKVNEVLGVIMDMKNVRLTLLEWVYDEEAVALELIQKAMMQAKRKANAMTSVVGYRVVGIRACSDSYEVPNVNVTVHAPLGGPRSAEAYQASQAGAAASRPGADIGTAMRDKKEITAIASVEFIIEPASEGASGDAKP